MITKGKDVIGLRVLTINDGKQIQTVDDIVYDPSEQKVKALLVNSGGLFSKAEAIPIDEILSIGKDAVLVQDDYAIMPVTQLSDRVHRIAESDNNLVKTRVITQDGTELGQVYDIVFDSTDGSVQELEVSQGGVKNLGSGKKRIKPEDIVTVGVDATIVSTFTEDKFEAQADEGGAKGLLNNAKDKVSEVGSQISDKAQETAEKVKALPENPKVQSTIADAREKTIQVADDARDKGAELKDRTQDRIDDIKNDPTNQARIDAVKDNASSVKEHAQSKTEEFKPQNLTEQAKNPADGVDTPPRVAVTKTTKTEIRTSNP